MARVNRSAAAGVSDQIAGAYYHTVKIAIGAEGAFDGFLCDATPLPVRIVGSDITVNVTDLSGIDVTDRANRILGRVGVDILTSVANIATDTGLASVYARLGDGSTHVAVDSMPAISVSPDVTDRVGRLLGHVTVDNFPSVAGLTDTELRAAPVPVSGPVTDAQLRATAVPVSGTFWPATQPVSGTFWQATQPVSAAALPLPSGASTEATLAAIKAKTDNIDVALSTRAVTGLTDAQLRAAAVPVSGSFFQATQPVSGTFWQSVQPVSATALPLPTGAATEATLAAIKAKTDNLDVALSTRAVTGLTDTQLRAVPVPVSGSFFQATQPVSGTFWQATQPVSIAATVAVSGPLTDAQMRASAVPVSGAFFQATQPVSGTFWQSTQPISAAALPLPSGASTEATLAAIKAKTDNIDVALSTRAVTGLTDAQLRAAAVPVSGSFFQATQPVSIAATVAVSGPLTDAQLRAGAVPVSAAALPLPSGAATESTLSSVAAATVESALDLDAILARTPALGAAVKAASSPVNIASDQVVPTTVAGVATETTLQTVADSLSILTRETVRTRRVLEAVLVALERNGDHAGRG